MMKAVRETLDYVRQFKGRIIVVKISKYVLANKERLDNVVSDIVLLKHAGIDVIVTHSDAAFRSDSWSSLEPAVFLNINNISAIKGQLAMGITPIIFFGETPSLSSEKAIASLAIKFDAIKIVYVTNYDGIFKTGKSLIHEMDLEQAREILESPGAVTRETKSQLEVALMACEQGIPRIHIIGSRAGSLLKEIFTCDGSGTMIYESMYQEIRKAKKSDIAEISEIIRTSVKGISVTLDFIEKNISKFRVFAVDHQIYGCVMVMSGSGESADEIAYLGVLDAYENPLIFERLIRDALEMLSDEAKCVFMDPKKNTNLLGIYPWFKGLGFSMTSMRCGSGGGTNKVWVKALG